MKFNKSDLFTIPNILTYVRFLCVPFFLWMMFAYNANNNATYYLWSALAIFVFASATDIVDGYIARKFKMITDIGKVIDPIADKVLQVFAMIMLCVIGNLHWIFMTILLVKEVYMAVTSRYFMVVSKKQVNQHSNKWGKAGAVINFVGIIGAFFVTIAPIVNIIDIVVLAIGCSFAIVAAAQYTIIYAKEYLGLKQSGELDKYDKAGNLLPVVTELDDKKDDLSDNKDDLSDKNV
ncbi:MAG: CDP-alcohol phosphatidyltransferase family protein [Clostridia bacterium]